MKTAHIGKIFRYFRNKKHMTLEEVAGLCDMSVRGYEKIELGDSDPKWSTVKKVAYVLELDIGTLDSKTLQEINFYL